MKTKIETNINVFKPLFDKMITWVRDDFTKGIFIAEFEKLKEKHEETDVCSLCAYKGNCDSTTYSKCLTELQQNEYYIEK